MTENMYNSNTNYYNNNNSKYCKEEIDKIMQYGIYIENYKETLCNLLNYVDDLRIMPMNLKIKLPFIKKYINDDENETDLLENGSILLENKEIINNFDINNMFEFSDHYKNITSNNEFLDIIDDCISSIKKKKNKINKENIKVVKALFEYIFDILEKIETLFK